MWIRHALSVLGVSMPSNIDYPQSLQHLLYRRVWQSTLGEVHSQLLQNPEGVFIKPVEDCKAFSGLIASLDWMDYLLDQFPRSFPVYCSELVSMLAEYRVYVLNGRVLGICQYQGSADIQIDVQTVEQAVKTLFESEEGKSISGCAMDFAVMKVKESDGSERLVTGLVEVNEGFAIGIYEGVAAKDYTDMLIERWYHLVN
jgi:hypothetical protein